MTSTHEYRAPVARPGRLSLTRDLRGESWTACVNIVGRALWRVENQHRLASDCTMAFFDTAGDETLHVNVTHSRPTKPVSGWTGPGRTAGGFVYNRTFAATPPTLILRHVRDMVFADRA